MSSLKLNNKAKGKRATVSSSNSIPLSTRILQMKDKFIAWFMPKSIVEKFVWAYLASVIISFIFGIDHYYGFWGVDGWNMGLFTQCIMIAGFFAIAKVWEPNMWPVWCAMAGSTVVMLLGIVMRFGFDPLNNYEGLSEYYIQMFVSTIGQTSWYSSYVVTIVPIGIVLFFMTKNFRTKIISAIFSIISFASFVMQDSDSSILALGAMGLILFWVAFDDKENLKCACEVLAMMFGSFAGMGAVRKIFIHKYNGAGDAFILRISENKIMLVLFMVFLMVSIALNMAKVDEIVSKIYEKKDFLKNARVIIFGVIFVAIVVVIALIPLNTLGVLPWYIDNDYFIFDNSWGNKRGASWRACAMIFSDLSLGRKLIGVGPDSLAILTQVDQYREILNAMFSEENVLTCAHSEFFNTMIVNGVFGCIAYVGIFVSGIVRYLKKYIEYPMVLVGAMSIAMYCAHNSMCYQTVICTPFIFVIIGICESILNRTDKKR